MPFMIGLESCISDRHWDVLAAAHQCSLCLKPPDLCFPFRDITAKGVDNPRCLGVVHKLMHTWILICAPSLALAAKELFKWILANPSAEEYLHIWDCADILHQLNEGVG